MKMQRIFILTVSVLVFMNCGIKPNEKEYYGKWQNQREDAILIIDISSGALKGQYDDGSASYTISGLTWRPLTNNDSATKNEYPSGFFINGTATQVNNINNLSMGEQRTYEFYMSKDKTRIYRKTAGSGSAERFEYVFIKLSINN